MSRIDLVVFGATGFTGKKAVEEIVRVRGKYGNVTWAVAGRSKDKLEKLLLNISNKTGEDLSAIKVIVADVGDYESLKAMSSQAKVVVNCCGPYRMYGEPVVKAAIEGKANYVDVSGEPQFIETMQLRHGAAARDAGVFVVSACGFDSIPNDMGVVFLEKHFGGTLNSVESYLSTDITPEARREAARTGGIHYGTWESLVYSLAHYGELSALRKQMYPERLPTFHPKLLPRGVLHQRDGWCLPFPGADASIVYRTQRHLYETEHKRPVQMKPYVRFNSLIASIGVLFGASMLYLLSMLGLTRKLLLDHPRLFSWGMVSHEGPSEEVMNNTTFQFHLYGEGWAQGSDQSAPPDRKVVAKVKGVNPGYGATVTALIFSAITILREKDKMHPNGGVLTTGLAFRNTDLIKHLNDNNLTFEIVAN